MMPPPLPQVKPAPVQQSKVKTLFNDDEEDEDASMSFKPKQ